MSKSTHLWSQTTYVPSIMRRCRSALTPCCLMPLSWQTCCICLTMRKLLLLMRLTSSWWSWGGGSEAMVEAQDGRRGSRRLRRRADCRVSGVRPSGARMTLYSGCRKERGSRTWAGTMVVSARTGRQCTQWKKRRRGSIDWEEGKKTYVSTAILSRRMNRDFRFCPGLRPLWPGSRRWSLA